MPVEVDNIDPKNEIFYKGFWIIYNSDGKWELRGEDSIQPMKPKIILTLYLDQINCFIFSWLMGVLIVKRNSWS